MSRCFVSQDSTQGLDFSLEVSLASSVIRVFAPPCAWSLLKIWVVRQVRFSGSREVLQDCPCLLSAEWHQQPLRRAENGRSHPPPTLPPVLCNRRSSGHRILGLESCLWAPSKDLQAWEATRLRSLQAVGAQSEGGQVLWGAVPGAQRALSGLQGRRPDPESTESTLGNLELGHQRGPTGSFHSISRQRPSCPYLENRFNTYSDQSGFLKPHLQSQRLRNCWPNPFASEHLRIVFLSQRITGEGKKTAGSQRPCIEIEDVLKSSLDLVVFFFLFHLANAVKFCPKTTFFIRG